MIAHLRTFGLSREPGGQEYETKSLLWHVTDTNKSESIVFVCRVEPDITVRTQMRSPELRARGQVLPDFVKAPSEFDPRRPNLKSG